MSSKANVPHPSSDDERRLAEWLAANIGGTIERLERQSRWRGGWWADVRRGDELLKLYVREERKEEFPPWPLEHEARVLQLLEKHGVPAPHVYGICENPHAIIMEALEGSTSFAGYSDPARSEAAMLDFADAVARMHSIDPHEAVGPGLPMPQTPEEISLGCFKLCEDIYLKGKRRPDPRLEFIRAWIYRNIPRHRTKVSLLAVDSGQFMHDDGKVTGLFDMEYACLGDPMIDLASIPSRILGEGGPQSQSFFQRYRELTGDTLEPEVVIFHRVWWGICTPLIVAPNFDAPSATSTYFEYTWWYISPLLGVLLAIADLKGLKVDNSFHPGPGQPSRWAPLIDVMASRLPARSPDEPYDLTERRKVYEYIRRQDAHRDVEDDYVNAVAKLTGRAASGWSEADAALEEFVVTAGPEHDDDLIRLFHRWTVAIGATLLDGLDYNEIAYLHRPFPKFTELLA
jgi:aminoglycoside phosphotransferase (APT) family kinase protein